MRPRELAQIMDDEEAVAAEVSRRRMLRSFAAFVAGAWPIVEPAVDLDWGWHLDAICLHLEAVATGQIRRLLINIPPGHAKSLLVAVLFPAWMWTHRPGWRALFASYSAELATRDSVRARTLIESQWYQETFRPGWALKGDQNKKHHYETTSAGLRFSLGAKGGTGWRGDCIVVDDLISVEQSYSTTERKRANAWYDGTFTSRLNDKRIGQQIVVGQRLHVDDITGHLLAKGGWALLRLPTEYDPEQLSITPLDWKDPRTMPGELLFPERYPAEVIAEVKVEMGSRNFAAQHQQRPTMEGGNIFRRDWWQYYDVLPGGLQFLQSWDLSFKGKRDSSWCVGQLWGHKGAERWLVDQRRFKGEFPRALAIIEGKQKDAQWRRAGQVLIEDKANGPAIIATLKSKVRGIIPINPKGSKYARAQAVAPQVEAGQVYLPSGAAWLDDFLTEHAHFPNAPHDDQVDTTSQALARLRRRLQLFGPKRKT